MKKLYSLTDVGEINVLIIKILTECGFINNLDESSIYLEYCYKRTIESIYLTHTVDYKHPVLERAYLTVCNLYRRIHNNFTYTLHQDVGSNKLYEFFKSTDFNNHTKIALRGRTLSIVI